MCKSVQTDTVLIVDTGCQAANAYFWVNAGVACDSGEVGNRAIDSQAFHSSIEIKRIS